MTLRIGLIGAGFIARLGHLPALKSIGEVELVAVADEKRTLAQSVAREFGIPNVYRDALELLNDDSIDIIDVCTPPHVRSSVICPAAESGKHILVEKPLALSLDEALIIVEAVNKSGVKLSVAQNYRYFPSAVRARDRISQGRIGNIVSILGLGSTPFPTGLREKAWQFDIGVLFDFAPHLIDMILWLCCSPVEDVFALGGDFAGGMGRPNYAQIELSFENKAIAVADVSWVTGITRFALDIHGTAGHIVLDVRNDGYMEIHGWMTPLDELPACVRKVLRVIGGVATGRYFLGAVQFYTKLIDEFLESIRRNVDPPVSAERAAMTTAVLEAAEVSLQTHQPLAIDEMLTGKGACEHFQDKIRW